MSKSGLQLQKSDLNYVKDWMGCIKLGLAQTSAGLNQGYIWAELGFINQDYT